MNGWFRAAAVLSIAVTIAAYLPSMQGPFLWDDLSEIADNPAIRTLLPLWRPMFEGGDLPHRPVPYLTLAGNYAVGRLLAAAGIIASPLDTLPFHVVNVAIHLINGWLVYSVVVQVFARSPARPVSPADNSLACASGFRGTQAVASGPHAELLAWLAATLWLVHPLQSQAVSYVYQRIELLAGLASLATLLGRQRADIAQSKWQRGVTTNSGDADVLQRSQIWRSIDLRECFGEKSVGVDHGGSVSGRYTRDEHVNS